MTPPSNLCLLHVEISKYFNLKIEVTDLLKDGTRAKNINLVKSELAKIFGEGYTQRSADSKKCSGYAT